jgi:hypothetical protein
MGHHRPGVQAGAVKQSAHHCRLETWPVMPTG